MNRTTRWVAWATTALIVVQAGAFSIERDRGRIIIKENGKPVLYYNVTDIAPPPERANAAPHACYIHPLLDGFGNVVTEDFPADHPHHRGLFWGWPEVTVDGKTVSTWLLDGARPEFERIIVMEHDKDVAVVGLQNAWILEETGAAFVMEDVLFTLYASSLQERVLDVALRFRNVSTGPVSLHGASTDGKGYGGLTLRPDAANKPFQFFSARGAEPEDAFTVPSPWVDISYQLPRTSRYGGVAIFQHPSNPDYPHDGWMLRHYGLLVASWPGTSTATLAPGEAIELRYRILIHGGAGSDVNLDREYQEYVSAELAPEPTEEPAEQPVRGID